jgi:hypothetical protein
MNRVSGIPIASFGDPVRAALTRYEEVSEGNDSRVTFDKDTAARLVLTPDKGNSARSVSAVTHLGETVGKLYVIVFANEDGTGDESTYRMTDYLNTGIYPRQPKSMPRAKAGVHGEAHLTIASQFVAAANTDPVLYAGHLDLVSFNRARLQKLAFLGQSPADFNDALLAGTAEPTATYTVGYDSATGERYGDPHAVFNSRSMVQVCGFVAVTDEMVPRHANMLASLGAEKPELAF